MQKLQNSISTTLPSRRNKQAAFRFTKYEYELIQKLLIAYPTIRTRTQLMVRLLEEEAKRKQII